MTQEYVGIDYGLGRTNIDHQTGIRYGVISQHSVMGEIWEDFVPVYAHSCPACGNELEDGDINICPDCEYEAKDDSEWWSEEAIGQEYNGDGEYLLEYSESLSCFFVTKSTYYTFAKYCSPCAPGAADLDSPAILGVKAYCLGIDFFDSEYNPCPYVIYKIENDELVYTPGKETDETLGTESSQ